MLWGKKGALINAQQKSGYTPLQEAVHSGKIKTIKWLINKGAGLVTFLFLSMKNFY